MRKFLLTALLFCGLQTLRAQEQQVYSQFFMNPYVYNPAYAGVEGHTAVFVMYRNQWAGIEGSPNIAHVAFHTPLKGGMSVGAGCQDVRILPVGQPHRRADRGRRTVRWLHLPGS